MAESHLFSSFMIQTRLGESTIDLLVELKRFCKRWRHKLACFQPPNLHVVGCVLPNLRLQSNGGSVIFEVEKISTQLAT